METSDSLDVVIAGIPLRVARSRHEPFWRLAEAGDWEPETLALLRRMVTPDTTYVDVGAWIGPTVLVAARSARRAIAFEPDPAAASELRRNLALNEWSASVALHGMYVGSRAGTIRMANQRGESDSLASSLFADSPGSFEARSVRLDTVLADEGVRSPLVIKIDIEGAEYDLIPSMAGIIGHYRPRVLLSLHPFLLTHEPAGRGSSAVRVKRKLRLLREHARVLRALRPLGAIFLTDGSPLSPLALLARVARDQSGFQITLG